MPFAIEADSVKQTPSRLLFLPGALGRTEFSHPADDGGQINNAILSTRGSNRRLFQCNTGNFIFSLYIAV
jgi:hypothetical protein